MERGEGRCEEIWEGRLDDGRKMERTMARKIDREKGGKIGRWVGR